MDEFSVTQRLIESAGDPFFAAAPALAEMLPSERDKLLREHYAVEYREHLRRIMSAGAASLDEEEGEE